MLPCLLPRLVLLRSISFSQVVDICTYVIVIRFGLASRQMSDWYETGPTKVNKTVCNSS